MNGQAPAHEVTTDGTAPIGKTRQKKFNSRLVAPSWDSREPFRRIPAEVFLLEFPGVFTNRLQFKRVGKKGRRSGPVTIARKSIRKSAQKVTPALLVTSSHTHAPIPRPTEAVQGGMK
jgi:hypothetical protein